MRKEKDRKDGEKRKMKKRRKEKMQVRGTD